MKTQTKDLMYFEEAHTECLRNSRVLELALDNLPNAKYAYVIAEKDSEYGHLIHRSVAFNMSDAFKMACDRASMFGSEYCPKYESFILVNKDEVNDFIDMSFDELEKTNLYFDDSRFVILSIGHDSKVYDRVELFTGRTIKPSSKTYFTNKGNK